MCACSWPQPWPQRIHRHCIGIDPAPGSLDGLHCSRWPALLSPAPGLGLTRASAPPARGAGPARPRHWHVAPPTPPPPPPRGGQTPTRSWPSAHPCGGSGCCVQCAAPWPRAGGRRSPAGAHRRGRGQGERSAAAGAASSETRAAAPVALVQLQALSQLSSGAAVAGAAGGAALPRLPRLAAAVGGARLDRGVALVKYPSTGVQPYVSGGGGGGAEPVGDMVVSGRGLGRRRRRRRRRRGHRRRGHTMPWWLSAVGGVAAVGGFNAGGEGMLHPGEAGGAAGSGPRGVGGLAGHGSDLAAAALPDSRLLAAGGGGGWVAEVMAADGRWPVGGGIDARGSRLCGGGAAAVLCGRVIVAGRFRNDGGLDGGATVKDRWTALPPMADFRDEAAGRVPAGGRSTAMGGCNDAIDAFDPVVARSCGVP